MRTNKDIAAHTPIIEASLRMSKELLETTDVLILCGGLGTRFRQVRQDIPKCLAPVRNRPFIDYLLSIIVAQGFNRIVLATGYLGYQVETHVKRRDDAVYIFAREETPLGTGGAIKCSKGLIYSDPFLVLNGDSYIDFPLKKLLEKNKASNADISILLSSTRTNSDCGNVELGYNQRVTSFTEKYGKSSSSYTNAGIYCLRKHVLDALPQHEPISLEKECLPLWINRFLVTGVTTEREIHDIGTVDRYVAAQNMQFGILESHE